MPPAPKPTRARKIDDPREVERARRIREHREYDFSKDKNKKVVFWDEARLAKMRRMWNEGFLVEEISREIGCHNVKQCHNRIDRDIADGILKRRRVRITAEEYDGIAMRLKAGMKPKEIATDLRLSIDVVRKAIRKIKGMS